MPEIRHAWPHARADMAEIESMVVHALSVDGNWKPPPRFAYVTSVFEGRTMYDFVAKRTQLQNHIDELFAAMPPGAKTLYYLSSAEDGVEHVALAAAAVQAELADERLPSVPTTARLRRRLAALQRQAIKMLIDVGSIEADVYRYARAHNRPDVDLAALFPVPKTRIRKPRAKPKPRKRHVELPPTGEST